MALACLRLLVTDLQGNVVPNANVEVRREAVGSPLALLKTDRQGTTPAGNGATLFADATGLLEVFAPGGAYRCRAYKTVNGQLWERTWRYVAVGTAAETDAERGLAGGVLMTFGSAIADADPGAGTLRFNNATPANVTFLYVDVLDAYGNDLTAWLSSLDDGTSASDRGRIRIQKDGDPAVFTLFRVTGAVVTGSGYRKVPVALISSSGSVFAAGDGLAMFDAPGAAAPIAADVPYSGSTNLSANNVEGALDELDVEKVAKAGDTMTGNLIVAPAAGSAMIDARSSGDTVGAFFRLNRLVGGTTLRNFFELYLDPNATGNIFGRATDDSAASKSVFNIIRATGEFRLYNRPVLVSYTNRAGIASIPLAMALSVGTVYLAENRREGWFKWVTGDQSARVSTDPNQGMWIAPTADTTGASGVWERITDSLTPQMFGAVANGATDDRVAVLAWFTVLRSAYIRLTRGIKGVLFGNYYINGNLDFDMIPTGGNGGRIEGNGNKRSDGFTLANGYSVKFYVSNGAALFAETLINFSIVGNVAGPLVRFGSDDYSDGWNSSTIDLHIRNNNLTLGAEVARFNYCVATKVRLICNGAASGRPVALGGSGSLPTVGLKLRQAIFCEFSVQIGNVGKALVLGDGYNYANTFTSDSNIEEADVGITISSAQSGGNTWLGGKYLATTMFAATAAADNLFLPSCNIGFYTGGSIGTKTGLVKPSTVAL